MAALAACSSSEGQAHEEEGAEVAGVVIERQDGEDESSDVAVSAERPVEDLADGPADGPAEGEAEETAVEDRPESLELLRSGPARIGTVWLATDGQWVGIDGQSLELGVDAPTDIRLDALVEVTASPVEASLTACQVRVRAPEDAELQGAGALSVAVVIERQDGELQRTVLDPLDLDVDLAPGEGVDLVAGTPDGSPVALDADDDAQVRCEGRFDRT